MEDHNDYLISWLQTAYQTEKELLEVLDAHAKEAKGYSDIVERIESHLKETKIHEERVEACLRELGLEPNKAKRVISNLMGNMKGAVSDPNKDKVIKNAISDYASEYFEIALYSAIAKAAEILDHPEIVEMCEEIKKEEKDMAIWLEDNLPLAVEKFFS